MSSLQEPFGEKQTLPSSTISEEPPKPSYEPRRPRSRRPPSVFWPIVFISAGVLLLLSNLGYLSPLSWSVVWRLWPLLLVALGIDLLIGRRSVIGAIFSTIAVVLLIGGIVVLALLTPSIPAVSDWIAPLELPTWIRPEFETRHVEYPLQGVEQAKVYIDWSSVPGYLSALEDSPNLIEGDIDYRGQLTFDASVVGGRANVKLDSSFFGLWSFGDQSGKRWDVRLSPEVSLDLRLDTGSGPCDFDLTGLQISKLVLDAGSGPIDLTLPSGSTFEAEIDGGSGSITIVLPESVGARVELDAGSGPFNPDERFELVRGKRYGDGVWETDNYGTAEHTITLKIDQGSGTVNIR
ncbi:hypothetical protein DRN74_05625 [Candidatus Micrarchaeota archaeon]|nr:MAG: hypothetical protein DRN74_05625 [Candidatus Micrarchaeota archaeon]